MKGLKEIVYNSFMYGFEGALSLTVKSSGVRQSKNIKLLDNSTVPERVKTKSQYILSDKSVIFIGLLAIKVNRNDIKPEETKENLR